MPFYLKNDAPKLYWIMRCGISKFLLWSQNEISVNSALKMQELEKNPQHPMLSVAQMLHKFGYVGWPPKGGQNCLNSCRMALKLAASLLGCSACLATHIPAYLVPHIKWNNFSLSGVPPSGSYPERAGRAQAEYRKGHSPRFAESSQSLASFVPGKIRFTWEELRGDTPATRMLLSFPETLKCPGFASAVMQAEDFAQTLQL